MGGGGGEGKPHSGGYVQIVRKLGEIKRGQCGGGRERVEELKGERNTCNKDSLDSLITLV